MIWSVVYITMVLLADYTAMWFIPLPLFGMLPLGTILFGFTFTARDYVHRMGRKYVYMMIGITVIMASVLSVFTDVPMRIVIASALAIALAETVDTEIYHKLLKKVWIVRVLVSNGVSVPIDTILFNAVAFIGVFPLGVIIQIVYADIIAKYVFGLSIAGLRTKAQKKAELQPALIGN